MFKIKNIFLISLLVLLLTCCFEECDNPTGPDPIEPPEDIYLPAEVKYQRVDDNPACPITASHFDEEVRFDGNLNWPYFLPPEGNQMNKIGKNLFLINLPRVRVNYPYETYHFIDPFIIFIIDNVFFTSNNQECSLRAHNLRLNGKLMKRVYRGGSKMGYDFGTQGEYILVRMDRDGIFHEVDK